MNKKTPNRNNMGMLVSYLLPLLMIALIFMFFNANNTQKSSMTHNALIAQLDEGNVKSLVYQGEKLRGVLNDKDKTPFEVIIPQEYFSTFYQEHIRPQVQKGTLEMVFQAIPEPNPFLAMLPDILFLGLLGFMMYSFFKRTAMQNSSMNSFGKSKAQMHQDKGERVTFQDVAGLQEEKEELLEIVDFLKNPRKFIDLGARIPKGVLLVGPPGTGKTYLSKAVAGEAGVPFFSISGSDFVEMFVGVGASRVRDLFTEGKKNAPCIIFVDEIDAVGRRRGAGLGGGNDEREQTLNQLLVEMDGFDKNEGIIIMAATNRPDILDPALLRPGRFDRQVLVGMPDAKAREAILKVHTRNKPVADDIDYLALARQTAGFTPADLENMANEAALLTAREGKSIIDMKTFVEASIKVVAGPEKKSREVIEKERVLTAYHESGHAIVTRALPDTDKVNMITIVPRGYAGGFTSFLPEDDRQFMSRNQMLTEIVSFLGGRAAEALVLDDISTGASNDIERATKMARNMVVKYGMSVKLGPVAYEEGKDNVFLGNDLGQIRSYSEETAQAIDEEVRHIMNDALDRAMRILHANREMLDQLANTLLEKETLHAAEFETLFQTYGVLAQENEGVNE
ncbi:ATP-dependent zinc metalloprotease FtsH [Murdochiella massiliensis]|uniref:ATP-dependent zinc metalloprotease FtsH n=1 Tax=Murdochiella massiliensis TaxID=1673723 RepID=UPI00096ACFE3|nr:ATP-dependent zinc metalloprotease FtsH [Murdochiella massiliensis]